MADAPPAVVLVPAHPDAPTSPPHSPWWLGIKRLRILLAPLLPLLLKAVYDEYQAGHIAVPKGWAPYVTLAVAVALSIYKGWTEQQRQDAALSIEAQHGLPMGRPLPADAMATVMFTNASLPRPPQTR